MEKPDSAGYVNVLWPSKNVPHGGIFHTPTVEPSVDQQKFLRVLLEESKLSAQLRQRRVAEARGVGGEVRQGRAQALGQGSDELARPRTSRRRSLSAIRSSGALEVDTYRPVKRGEDRERLKEQLANAMAVGEEAPKPPLRRSKPAPALPTAKETWNDLVTQIRERAEWLAEMEWLGQAAPHRDIVHEQIAERMRALDALDLESECSSARSSARSTCSGAPQPVTTRTVPPVCDQPPSIQGRSSSLQSAASRKSVKPPSGRRARQPEENVAAYGQLTPLGYSPRRRM